MNIQMKSMCLTGALLFGALSAFAQTATVRGGSLGIAWDPTLMSTLQGQGITMRVASTPDSFNGADRFAIISGNVDVLTGGGEILTEGAVIFTSGNKHIKVENLVVETSGAGPVISATYYVDGKYMGRSPFMALITPSPLGTKLAIGVDSVVNMQATLAPYFANLVAVLFRAPILQGNVGISTLDLLTKLTLRNRDGCLDKTLCVIN